MVTLKSHFPRNERDSKLQQYLTQIKLSSKTNGQHRKNASKATCSIPLAHAMSVKFC